MKQKAGLLVAARLIVSGRVLTLSMRLLCGSVLLNYVRGVKSSVVSSFLVVPSLTPPFQRSIADSRVLILGTVQALFESSMYIFVFIYGAVLDAAAHKCGALCGGSRNGPATVPYGIVFASFMVQS